jgi:predicted transcriptional regulator
MDKENPKTILTHYLNADDELKKLILQKDAFSILKYIRNNQVHASSITKEEISRYMDEKQICSRPTTLKLIQRLLDHKIILNDKKRDNTFSSLVINPSFDFGAIEKDLFSTFIKEIQQHFADFNDETKGANTILVDNLLATVDNFSKKEVKQSPRLRPEPRMTKNGKVSHY